MPPQPPRLSLCFLGAPGVGKGTYANKVVPRLKIMAISTGDLIRAEIKSGSAKGKELASYTNSGKLVPDSVVIDMVKARVSLPDCARGYILDGFPRTIAQAERLQAFEPIRLVVNIVLKESYLMDKIMGRRVCPSCNKNFNVAHISNAGEGVEMPPLLPSHGDPTKCECGTPLVCREDDQEATVKQRLAVYHAQTKPLVQYYKDKGVLRDFEVKRGLDDLPKLYALLEKELHVNKL